MVAVWAPPLVTLLLCGTVVIGQGYPSVDGYTVRQGDCPGNDIWGIYGDGITLQTCADRCSSHLDCVCFMFYDNRRCYPKTQTCHETDKSNPKNVFYDKSTSIPDTDSPGVELSGGAIAGIVIGVLVGVGLLAVFVHHCKKTGSQPSPANRANTGPRAARVNNTVMHSPTVVSQNPAYNPYPPPPQYPPPPAYNTAVNIHTHPPGSQYTPQFYSSLDPAYAPPPEPVKYGMT
uniref:Apple domain-containing protein n=1 Tax=Branchiostoma floridae TaxID=7739 RepID=C3XYG3_BRAFL|eukprot:XP_002610838.1 hypothetical protein BRAFLDRAFT_127472 [Branchiostoma floridae]